MENKYKSPVGSPVDSPKSPVASAKLPVGSPKSPIASPKSPIAEDAPVPTTSGLLPENYWIDAPQTDDDDGVEDNASSTASISSSVLQYRTINGRTYHSTRGNAEYWGSNDERQSDALDLMHHAHTLIIDGKLCLAPLKDDIKKVVDIATGTGSWAIDFADAYPNCEVIGTDVSPIQPSWVPPNLKFEIDDCTLPWTFDPNSIDFVHARYLVGSIRDWPGLFKEAYRCIKPGGYFQSFDGGGSFEIEESTTASADECTAMKQWGELFTEGGKKLGQSFTIVYDGTQRRALEEAGFVDIQEQDFKVPVGTWAKDPVLKQVGACTYRALYDDVEGYLMYLAGLIGWSKEAVMVYAAQFRRELRDQRIHKCYRVKVIWGRKPE